MQTFTFQKAHKEEKCEWKAFFFQFCRLRTEWLLAYKGYNTHSPLDGIGDEQTSGSVDFLILLLDVLCDLLENLREAGAKPVRWNCTHSKQPPEPKWNLLVSRLHAEEDEVGRGAGETSLQVRLASDFLRLRVVGVQRLHRVLKQSSLNLGKFWK